jgi:hypothetical protein
MNNLHSLTVESIARKLQIAEITTLIAASICIQFIVHISHSGNNIPLGAVLLPMFYVPLIAIIFYDFKTGLITAAAGPLINYLLTRSPQIEIVPQVTFELIIFVLTFTLLLRYNRLNYFSAVISIISAKLLSWLVFSLFSPSGLSSADFINPLTIAYPGILILLLLNILLLYIKNRY